MTVLRAPDIARNIIDGRLAELDRAEAQAAALAAVAAAEAAVKTARRAEAEALYRRRLAIRAARALDCSLAHIGEAADCSRRHVARELDAPILPMHDQQGEPQ